MKPSVVRNNDNKLVNNREEEAIWDELAIHWKTMTAGDLAFVRELRTETASFAEVPQDTLASTTAGNICAEKPYEHKKRRVSVTSHAVCPPPTSCLDCDEQLPCTAITVELASARGGLDEVNLPLLDQYHCNRNDSELQKYNRLVKKRTVSHTDISEDVQQILGMVNGDIPLFLDGERTDITTEKALAGGSRFSLLTRSSHDVGRWYQDQWEEDAFISKHDPGGPLLTTWSDIFHDYSEDHDGVYFHWHRQERRRQCYSPSVSKVSGYSSSVSYLNPPVPVSCHHPACWGPGTRRRWNDFIEVRGVHRILDVHKVHPACVTNTIVHPPARLSSQESSWSHPQLSSLDPYFAHRVDYGNHFVDRNMMDELDLASLIAQKRLNYICQSNERQLKSIEEKVQREYSLNKLIAWRDSINRCLESIVSDVLVPTAARCGTSSDAESYMHLKPVCAKIVSNQNTSIPAAPYVSLGTTQSYQLDSSQLNNNLSNETGTIVDSTTKTPEIHSQITATLMYSKHNDPFIKLLRNGNFVEVFLKQKIGKHSFAWKLGIIIKVYKDGDLPRLFKVRPLDGISSDCVMIAVEDNYIAEVGTHIPKHIVKLHIEYFSSRLLS